MADWKKTLIVLLISGSLSGCSAIDGINNIRINKSIAENYDKTIIEKDLDELIEKQEKILKIKHFGKPEIFQMPPILRFSSAASYVAEEDRIYFRIYHKMILAHELGHFYPDKLNESFGKGNWPIYEKFPSEFAEGEKGKKMISEGVANYFGVRTFGDTSYGKKLELKYEDFEIYRDSLGINAFYDVGYLLVKPVLDKNVRKGVEYLMENTPSDKELKDIFVYRERILRGFEKFMGTK